MFARTCAEERFCGERCNEKAYVCVLCMERYAHPGAYHDMDKTEEQQNKGTKENQNVRWNVALALQDMIGNSCVSMSKFRLRCYVHKFRRGSKGTPRGKSESPVK
jgi:hypothetical protein